MNISIISHLPAMAASIVALAAYALPASAAHLEFSGSPQMVISVTPEASTGLDCIYVAANTSSMTATYTASSASATVNWYRYSTLGGAFAEEVASTSDGARSTISLSPDDMGYIVEDGTSRHYYWITNYANHSLELRGISVSDESDCISALLDVDGSADPIRYYTINGVPRELDRQLTVSYTSLAYDESTDSYITADVHDQFASISGRLRIEQPLCDTRFTLSGDRFTTAWGHEQSVATDWYQARAVEAHTSAIQDMREVDNETSVDSPSGLGGSAPVEIEFSAQITDAVLFTEWQISSDITFDVVDLRYNTTAVTYTFREYGNYYVRFVAANADGSCEFTSQTYEINIGDSNLQCPNAFSPGGSPGVNDEWKVSYKSIVDFECHIYNRWGVKMATLTHPSQGWDGKHGGKVVPSGVYYYVIKARGADGRKYNLSGDINVINYRMGVGASAGDDNGVVPAN